MIKSLCFTQIDNTKDAVVCFVHRIINHKNQLLTNGIIQLSLGVLSNKTDKIYQRAIAVRTYTLKQNR